MSLNPRARFQLSDGPGSQGTIAAQFNCEGTTLSGVEFELSGAGYRVSLVKRRFVSGKTFGPKMWHILIILNKWQKDASKILYCVIIKIHI